MLRFRADELQFFWAPRLEAGRKASPRFSRTRLSPKEPAFRPPLLCGVRRVRWTKLTLYKSRVDCVVPDWCPHALLEMQVSVNPTCLRDLSRHSRHFAAWHSQVTQSPISKDTCHGKSQRSILPGPRADA